MMRGSAILCVGGVLLGAGVAVAQPITVTAQTRFLEGSTVSVNDGVKTTEGPVREETSSGDFGFWPGALTVLGNVAVSATQESEYNWSDTITINSFMMNLAGGGGPGSSGSATLTNHCSFTFTVPEQSTFTLNTQFATGPSVVVTLTLTGPSADLSFDTSTGETVLLENLTGGLSPGEYTLSLVGTGTIGYEGPGGNGSGAGGPSPLLTFVVAPGGDVCTADFNADNIVNSQDFFDFLTAFFAQDDTADFNGDDAINSQDFFDFLTAFFAGC